MILTSLQVVMTRYLSKLIIRQLLLLYGRRQTTPISQCHSFQIGLTSTNGMSCNPSKCKELTIKRRGNRDLHSPIGMIPNCKEVEIMGVTFQCDSKFSVHVKNKLIKTNKSLLILRTLRKDGYNQSEIDLLLIQQFYAPGGGYLRNFWVRVCRWDPGTLNLYQSQFS